MKDFENEDDKSQFEYFSRLAKEDPEEFERKRKERLEEAIGTIVFQQGLSKEREARLRGFQWQIDVERLKYIRNPIGYCVKLYNMMWKHILGRNGLVEAIQALDAGVPLNTGKLAKVLPFIKKDKK